MNIKKVAAMGMAVLMAGAMVACGNDGSSSGGSSGGTSGATTDNTVTPGVITVATTGNHNLFTMGDDPENLTGFEIDMWNEIGRRLGKEVKFVQTDFTGIFGNLESGRVDTGANQIGRTAEREEKYYFSDNYFFAPYRLEVAADNNEIQSIEDMKGKVMGLPTQDASHSYIKELDPEGEIEIVDYPNDNYHQDIANHRIDGNIQSAVSFDEFLKKSGLPLKLVGDPIYYENNAYPFAKTEKGKSLCQEVNAALKEMREDGTMNELSTKWFGADYTVKADGTY